MQYSLYVCKPVCLRGPCGSRTPPVDLARCGAFRRHAGCMNSLLEHTWPHYTVVSCHPWTGCLLLEHHGRSVRGRPLQARAASSRSADGVPDANSRRGSLRSNTPQQQQQQQQQRQPRLHQQQPAKKQNPVPWLPLQVVLRKLDYEYDQLKHWQVQLRRGGALVGTVTKVIQMGPVGRPGKGGRQPGPSSILLQVVKQSVLEPYGYQGREVHRIPLVPDIVSHADPATRTLYITPPPGLLELGRQQLLQGFLSLELLPYARPVGVPGGLPGSPLFPDRWMPTRVELVEAGRQDLVDLIQDLGGFTQAALLLGLRSRRRPPGYWEQLELLGAELEAFVWGSWLALPDPEAPGELYYYNMVTQAVRWEAPPPPPGIWSAAPAEAALNPPSSDGSRGSSQGLTDGMELQDEDWDEEEEEVEAEDSMSEEEEQQLQELHVMPTAKAIAQAGRWDLHHAIIAQGGYKRVGDMLGWRPARCSTAPYLSNLGRLRGELEGLGMDLGLPAGRMPTRQQLVDAGQHTLAYAVAQLGGWQVVSRQLGLTPQRQARRPVPATPQQLAEALTQWMAANPPPAMPPRTMAALKSDPMCSATQLPRTSRTQGVGAGAVGPSTSRSSRDRLAGGSDVQHRGWQQLPTQKQLLAAGRRDLVAGLQKHGARSVGALLGLPVSPQGPTTKGRVTLAAIQEAIAAGADTPAKMRTWLCGHLTSGLPSVARQENSATESTPTMQVPQPSPAKESAGAGEATAHQGTTNNSSIGAAPSPDACSSPPHGEHPVSREHLTVLLRGWVQEGDLVRVGRGRYALGDNDAAST